MDTNSITSSILQTINTHSMYYFLKGNQTNTGNGGNSEIFNYIFMITISSIIASIIPTFILFLSKIKMKGLKFVKNKFIKKILHRKCHINVISGYS